ncbi:hypothetical protein, partial [Serratia marcescens]|uniref:hypothetical protein n=1 Tax=Serratia marcescens TaxID=615 RepID=UPI0023807C02
WAADLLKAEPAEKGQKKSQHPSWLSKHWKQCEQCRAFAARVSRIDALPGTHRNNNHYHSHL